LGGSRFGRAPPRILGGARWKLDPPYVSMEAILSRKESICFK
jgi:hypothetical protein